MYKSLVNKKPEDNDSSLTCEAPELENIFHYSDEQACFKNQFADNDNTVPFQRWPTVDEEKYHRFLTKVKDTKTGQWFKSGENGIRSPSGKIPKRTINTIMRLKIKGEEYLLSSGHIVAYTGFGDECTMAVLWPEKYTQTNFSWSTVPNFETGYSERKNQGPSGSQLIYTLPWSVESATSLFNMRNENEEIQFLVKSEQGRVFEVKKPFGTLEDNWKLFCENSFDYLYNALYISTDQKILAIKQAEADGILNNKMSDDEIKASVLAQESLSDKQKHIAIQ